MEELNQSSKSRSYMRIPEDKDYTGAFLMEERQQLCLRKQWIITKLLEGTPEFDDYNGNPINLGDIFRHIEKNGADISELQPLIQKKGMFARTMAGMLFVPGSQNGNK